MKWIRQTKVNNWQSEYKSDCNGFTVLFFKIGSNTYLNITNASNLAILPSSMNGIIYNQKETLLLVTEFLTKFDFNSSEISNNRSAYDYTVEFSKTLTKN